MEFREVLTAVRAWFESVQGKYGQRIREKVVLDSDTAFRIFFESADKMGELMVAEADFAPYRYVSFLILRMDEEPVFCYYDSDASTLREIIGQLDAGLKMM